MSELHATQPTAEEASRQIAADIRAYPQNGPDKREGHLRLFGGVVAPVEINALWADRYAEIALAGRDRYAFLDARLNRLRPQYDEAKRKLAQQKIVGFRRTDKPSTAPATPPAQERKAVIVELIRREFGNAKRKPEEEPEPEQPAEQPEATPFPLDGLILPGVAGEVQDYFLRMSPQPSRIISLGVGLMVPTVLVSGNVCGPSGPKGCALHQTVVIVAPTFAGKQWAIDCTKECVSEAGKETRQLLGPNRFKSGPALIRWVTEHRVSLCIQDEFGRLLAKFANPKSNPSEIEINDRMREFWAIGPGGIYNSPHGAAKGDDSEMIVDPRLSIFGFGVQQEFYTACEVEDIDNGFLNRMAVLEEPVALELDTDFSGPNKVPYNLKLNLGKLFGIAAMRLDWSPAAKEIYVAEVKRIFREPDERRRKLCGRTPEKIVRAASTFAASRFAKRVERSDMEIAQTIMRHSDEVFQVGIDKAQTKRKYDHAQIKLEIIRRLKDNFRSEDKDDYGRPIKDEHGNQVIVYEASEAELRRTFRHNTTRRDAYPNAVGDLLDSGALRRFHRKTGGRDKNVLRLMEE
jgi:hypothetical protein